jgi:hypothetical protein
MLVFFSPLWRLRRKEPIDVVAPAMVALHVQWWGASDLAEADEAVTHGVIRWDPAVGG